MADDYRQRCADAAMKAWDAQAVLCDHSQIIPIGSIVDAVLAERDDELAALRRELESVTDRMEADRLKHRAERDIWKECDEKQWLQIRASEAAIAATRERLDALIEAGFGAVGRTLRELRRTLDGQEPDRG